MTYLRAMWELLWITFWEWWNDNTFRLAAALSFYMLFSLAPLLMIAVTLAGLVFGRQGATDQVVNQLQALTGEQGASAAREIAEHADFGTGVWGFVVGVVIVVVGSTWVFGELQAALNEVWDVKADPDAGLFMSVFRDRTRGFLIALGTGFLLLVSLVLSAGLSGAETMARDRLPGVDWLWRAGNLIGSFGLITLLFAMIYRYLPDVRITWRDVGHRVGGDGGAVRAGQICHRRVPRAGRHRQRVRRSGVAGGAADLDLLLRADLLLRGRVHAGLLPAVRVEHPPQTPRHPHRPQERHPMRRRR